MKIFITGATGFIGKHLVHRLVNEGHHVTINLREGKESPFGDDVSFYYTRMHNIERDIKFFNEELFDGIIHLASLYVTTHKPEDIDNLIESNVLFGTYILECAAQARTKWFINTGTFWQHYNNKEYSPVNLYAATKQAFESIAQYYIDTNKIQFNTLKLSDTFGPNDTRTKIFNIWDRISKTGEILEMSAGEQLIDISHINDVINSFIILIDHIQNKDIEIPNGASFAVKAKKSYKLRELAHIFEKATGKKLNIHWGKRPYREREVMIPWKNGKTVPGWRPEKTISNYIKDYLHR